VTVCILYLCVGHPYSTSMPASLRTKSAMASLLSRSRMSTCQHGPEGRHYVSCIRYARHWYGARAQRS
jgi:hypothetical protein